MGHLPLKYEKPAQMVVLLLGCYTVKITTLMNVMNCPINWKHIKTSFHGSYKKYEESEQKIKCVYTARVFAEFVYCLSQLQTD